MQRTKRCIWIENLPGGEKWLVSAEIVVAPWTMARDSALVAGLPLPALPCAPPPHPRHHLPAPRALRHLLKPRLNPDRRPLLPRRKRPPLLRPSPAALSSKFFWFFSL